MSVRISLTFSIGVDGLGSRCPGPADVTLVLPIACQSSPGLATRRVAAAAGSQRLDCHAAASDSVACASDSDRGSDLDMPVPVAVIPASHDPHVTHDGFFFAQF